MSNSRFGFRTRTGEISNIIEGLSYDNDAVNFITSAGITDPNEIIAIQQLVNDLKNQSIWNKLIAIYPFVGGLATTHKFNLKDPRDLDIAYRLQFFGGWVHSSTGAASNGINGYANTFYTQQITNNLSFGVYLRLDKPASTGVAIGHFNNTMGSHIFPRFTNGEYKLRNQDSSASGLDILNFNLSYGFFQSSRNSSTSFKAYYNNLIYNFNQISANLAPLSYFLMSRNVNNTANNFLDNELAFAYMGQGLTDDDAVNLYNIVQSLQITLNRQV